MSNESTFADRGLGPGGALSFVTRGEVRATKVVSAPVERVFERLVDHAAMSDWPGIDDCQLVREGTPRNGLGALRRVSIGSLALDEEVVLFEPPHRFAYSIVKGLPVTHLGLVTLEEHERGSQIHWHVRLKSAVPFIAPIVARMLRRGLPGALDYLSSTLADPGGASDPRAPLS